MFEEMTIEMVLERISPWKLILSWSIVPKEFDTVKHSPYRPGYDWLFTVERKLFRLIEPRILEIDDGLIGPGGVLSEGLSNAYCHGHNRNPSLPIKLDVYDGSVGIVITITDTGMGFDWKNTLDEMVRGKMFFHCAGNGFRIMNKIQHVKINYDNRGNTLVFFIPAN